MSTEFSFVKWLIENSQCIGAVANIFVCLSAVFVGLQVKYFFDDYKKKNTKAEFENSFKLTSFYINNIIPKMEVICFIYKLAKIDSIVGKKLKDSNLKHFDKEEFEEYFGDVKYEDILLSINTIPMDAFIEQIGSLPDQDIFEIKKRYRESQEAGEVQIKEFRKQLTKILWHNFVSVQNELEYFAMYFNSNLAHADVVYDSLHQTFTDFVKLLYPFFSRQNTRGDFTRKYFTNVKTLYVCWTEKEAKLNDETKKAVADVQKKYCGAKKI